MTVPTMLCSNSLAQQPGKLSRESNDTPRNTTSGLVWSSLICSLVFPCTRMSPHTFQFLLLMLSPQIWGYTFSLWEDECFELCSQVNITIENVVDSCIWDWNYERLRMSHIWFEKVETTDALYFYTACPESSPPRTWTSHHLLMPPTYCKLSRNVNEKCIIHTPTKRSESVVLARPGRLTHALKVKESQSTPMQFIITFYWFSPFFWDRVGMSATIIVGSQRADFVERENKPCFFLILSSVLFNVCTWIKMRKKNEDSPPKSQM